MSFARGFQTGWSAVDDAFKEREKRELREGLKRAGSLDQQTIFAKRQATPEEFARAQAETQALGQADAATFGFDSDFNPQGGMEMYAPAAPSPTAQVTTPSQYQIGGLTRETPFTQPEIQRARTEEMARVYEQQGMPEEAIRMRSFAQQQELTGLQLGQARRQEDYNTALQEINKQKFADPTERTAAILAATEAFDPATALDLSNKYTQNELNKITLRAQKFEEGYNQARAKGVDSVIKWYDGINDGFTLRREGNQIIQTDTAGNQRVFAQGTDAEIMKEINKVAQPDKFLKTAETEASIKKSEEETKLAEARRLGLPAAAQTDAQRQNIALADQFRKQIADANKLLENYAEGTPQHNAVLAERNAAAMALKDVNRLLQPGGLTRGGAQTAAPDFDEAGRKAAFDAARSGINPVTKEPYTKADKKQFEEYFGVKFPESAPAQPSKPANPRAARAAAREDTIPPAPPKKITIGRSTRERDNPEYAAWLETYGSRLGLK
jgi:hypothetical protein